MKPKAFKVFRNGAGLVVYVCRWCRQLSFSSRRAWLHLESCGCRPVGK